MSVVEIRPVEKRPQESVVSVLERALEAAKSGKLVSVALVGLYEDGVLQASANVETGIYRLLGALEAMKLELWERTIERR